MIRIFSLFAIVVSCILSASTVFAVEMPVAPAFLADIRSDEDFNNLSESQQKDFAAYQREISVINAGISSLQLLSCSSEKLTGLGSEFSFVAAEKIVFKCQVRNPGTASSVVFLGNRITSASAQDELLVSTSGYAGEVGPGATATFDVTFLSPVLPGNYRYDISLATLNDFGMPAKPVGQLLSYTGSLGASDAHIVGASLDKERYQWGEQGTLNVTVSKTDPVHIISMDGVTSDGSVCMNIAHTLFVTQPVNEYRFALPIEKPSCDIVTIMVSLLSREGVPLDSMSVPIGFGDEVSIEPEAVVEESDTQVSTGYMMAGVIVLSIIVLITLITIIIMNRRKSSGQISGMVWFLGLILWGTSMTPAFAAETQTLVVTAATYSGWEQTIEATKISGMLSKAGSNGGVIGQVQEANSYYQFKATNGTYFTLDGVNIGSTLTVVHWRDGLGFASYACDWSNCSFVASFGRGGGMTVGVVSATLVSGISSSWSIGGGAYNGGEQTNEATNISIYMSLAGGNGGVSGDSRYRYSYYQFRATNGVYFTLDGVNIGSTITIVHKQDWVGVANNLCTIFRAGGRAGWYVNDSGCSYIASWGRWNRTLGIVAPPVSSIPPVPPVVPADPPLIRATPAVDIKVNNSDSPLSMIPYASDLTISWTTIEADSCTASGPGWNGPMAVFGTSTIPATTDATYTLTCTNIIGSNSDSVSVTLVPRTCLGIAPAHGTSCMATLPVASVNYSTVPSCTVATSKCDYTCDTGYYANTPTTCVATQCNDGIDNDGDGKVDSPNDPGCSTGLNDMDETDVPPTITASPRTVEEGSQTTISWDTNNGNEPLCTLSGGTIVGNPLATDGGDETGSLNITIQARTTYTVSCPTGTASVMVDVIPTGFET